MKCSTCDDPSVHNFRIEKNKNFKSIFGPICKNLYNVEHFDGLAQITDWLTDIRDNGHLQVIFTKSLYIIHKVEIKDQSNL